MQTGEPVRNHVSVAVKNILIGTFILLAVSTKWVLDQGLPAAAGAAVLIASYSVLCCIRWARTYITLSDEDITVERNTLFKTKRTIPYTKIASINADRDIVDRLFGTTKLKININSSRNAREPEAVLTFESSMAERMRSELSQRIFDQPYDRATYEAIDPPVRFTNGDVVLHGLVSLSAYRTVTGAALLAYSVITVFFTEGSLRGVAVALFVVAVTDVLPMFISIIRYYDFRVFRTGDTIHLRHGAIQNYRTSFEIGRVNAVRVRRTLFARLLGKAYIEAEVVGLGGSGDDLRPMISILSDEKNIDVIMETILPEFIYERRPSKQPPGARVPMMINNVIAAAAALGVLAASAVLVPDSIRDDRWNIIFWAMVAAALPAALAHVHLSMRTLEFDMGEDYFTFRRGIVDQETVTMNYDKVQMISTLSGLPAKRRGLAKCRAMVLSSAGGQAITSGFFPEKELSRIADRMLERVNRRLE